MVAALACSALAFAGDESTHHFADAPIGKLALVYTATAKGATTALVEGPDGQNAIIHQGDTLAIEALIVKSVGRGCLFLANADGQASQLCVDEAGSPRS